MPKDQFDEHYHNCKRWEMQQSATRDAELMLFRKIWEACKPSEKNTLKSLLHTLEVTQHQIGKATQWRLLCPNLCTNKFDECPEEVIEESDLNRELSQSKELFIVPAEYLCAIACWEASEEYIPNHPRLSNHPRWPFADTLFE